MPETEVINTPNPCPSDATKDGYIGIFAMVAIIGIVCALFWYKKYSPFVSTQRFNVTFNQVAGLGVNGAVFVKGLNVGEVEKVDLDKSNHVVVGVRMNNDKVKIPIGAKFHIYNNNVIGARYLDIQLPPIDPSAPPLQPLDETMVIIGHDPARAEVVMSNIADSLNGVDFTRVEKNMEHDVQQLAEASKNVSLLSQKLQPVADHGLIMEKDVSSLACEVRLTSQKMNKLLSNPALTSDLKETAQKARETADSLRETIANLDSTLSDPKLRGDILQAMNSLKESSEHFDSAANEIKTMTGDEKVRGDIKQILTQANQTLNKLNTMLTQADGSNSNPLAKARDAVDHIDLAARQINQMLDKRHPLLHMMWGRPGHIQSPKSLANTRASE